MLSVYFIVSLISVIITTPYFIKLARERKFTSPDMNKRDKPMVVKMGGPLVLAGVLSAMVFANPIPGLYVILLVALMGLVDDFLDIPDWIKTLYPLLAGILLALDPGLMGTYINLPILGNIELGTLYLLLVPIGIAATSNLPNLLAGFNGLETTLGIIMLAALYLVIPCGSLYKTPSKELIIAIEGALVGFYVFNRYPSKIFPGNSLTYLIGATVGVISIINHVEVVGAIILLPQIVEFILKARSKFKAENFGKIDDEGRLNYDGKIYSLTHLIMKKVRPTEQELVFLLTMLQVISAGLAIAYYVYL